MFKITLQSLSIEMNITISQLIKNFSSIGIFKKENDYVTLKEKKLLLHYLSSQDELSIDKINVKKELYNNIKDKENNINNKLNDSIKNKKLDNTHNNTKFNEDTLNKVNKNDTIKKIVDRIDNKHDVINKVNNNISENITLDNINISPKKKKSNLKNFVSYKKIFTSVPKKNQVPLFNNFTNKKNFYNDYSNQSTDLKKKEHNNNTHLNKRNYTTNSNKKYNLLKKKNKFDNNDFQSNYESLNKRKSILYQNFIKPNKKIIKDVVINKTISVSELANKISMKGSEIIQKIMKMGHEVTIDQVIDQETAQLIVEEMGHRAVLRNENILEDVIIQDYKEYNKKFSKKIRPPIVTIMGHVDHGKTSLLDYIRTTKVAKSEFGGITQHIGAYSVSTSNGPITFLDTPGHAAFMTMRAKGVQITDIVVLVIASDDGVKPQTIEAIQHAKSANVPIIVAINKIDKQNSNPDKIKKELIKFDLLSEEWGGETIFVNISAVTGQGINDLLNSILLQAELLELYTISSGMANGVVLEANLDKYKGPVSTILIKEGQLKIGDNIVCGIHHGKVRSIINVNGEEILQVDPSIPVRILGLSGIPSSGDVLNVVKDEKIAKDLIIHRKNKNNSVQVVENKELNVENIFREAHNKSLLEIKIILKTDVQGSLEVISNVLDRLSDEISIKRVLASVGVITENDVYLAIASNSMIVGFNVSPNVAASKLIKIEKVDVKYYQVIYSLIHDFELLIAEKISSQYQTVIIGSAEVRSVFQPSKSIFIAGCMVINGIINLKNSIRIIRNQSIIYKGFLDSLRRFKDDTHEVNTGKECGIGIKSFNNFRVGDIIESFKIVKRTI